MRKKEIKHVNKKTNRDRNVDVLTLRVNLRYRTGLHEFNLHTIRIAVQTSRLELIPIKLVTTKSVFSLKQNSILRYFYSALLDHIQASV